MIPRRRPEAASAARCLDQPVYSSGSTPRGC